MNKAQALSLITPVLRHIPQKVTLLPYQLTLSLVRHHLKPLGLKPWARNSYATGTMVLGLSDLDLTMLIDRYPPVEEKQTLLLKLHQLKKVFPHMGETNFYLRSEIEDFLPHLNPYEALRDPKLTEVYPLNTKASTYHRLAFLSRMFESDRHQLLVNLPARLKKWRHHFEILGIPWPTQKLNLSRFMCLFVDQYAQLDLDPQQLKAYWLDQLHQTQQHSDPVCRLLFAPHRWAAQALEGPTTLNEPQRLTLQAHLDWEIWGLFSQLPLAQDIPFIKEHLMRLAIVAENHQLDTQYQALIKLYQIPDQT